MFPSKKKQIDTVQPMNDAFGMKKFETAQDFGRIKSGSFLGELVGVNYMKPQIASIIKLHKEK